MQCHNDEPHFAHTWFFFWPRYCLGIKSVAKDDWERANPSIGSKIISDFYRDRVVSVPHKHSYKFTSLSWSGPIGKIVNRSDYWLTFKCKTCKDQLYPAEVRIERWKWNEMTRTLPEVNQTWPQ
jgi:hypothetical protein